MPPPPRRNSFNSPPPAVMNKTGLPVKAGDRMVATAHSPHTTQGDMRTALYTYLTKAPSGPNNNTDILYNGDRLWTKVTLTLESAGPVAVGTAGDITPVLSGKGILLATDVPLTFTIGKGTILYIAATSVNRVKVQLEPLPWLEQITATLRDIAGSIAQALGRIGK